MRSRSGRTIRTRTSLTSPDTGACSNPVCSYRRWARGSTPSRNTSACTELSKNLPAPADPGAAVFKFFTISLTIGDQSDDSGGTYRANAVLTNGTKVKLLRLDGSGSTELQHDGDLQHQHATDVFYGQVEPGKPPVTWNGLARLEVIVEIAQRSNANEENISFTHSHISAQQENGIVADVQDSILDWRTNNITPQTIALTTNRPPAAPTVPTPEQRLG
jgi:hypothetical protein